MRVLTHTKLGNLATRAHTVLTDCFSMIDWRLPRVQWRGGATHYHAGTVTHYFLLQFVSISGKRYDELPLQLPV
jgi:hypothetical protein